MNPTFAFTPSNIKTVMPIIKTHIASMAYPWDSYLEENLDAAAITAIYHENLMIGYAAVHEGKIFLFHIIFPYFNIAPQAFEQFTQYSGTDTVYVLTHDPLLCALVAEWDVETTKEACWFYDAGKLPKPDTVVQDAVLQPATLAQKAQIEAVVDNFFEPDLERRLKDGEIFILMQDDTWLGFGIIERGRYNKDVASIGMIVPKKHRRKGVAQTVLWHLKQKVYAEGKTPVAGCWYYNILSRKSLARAGLRAVARGYDAKLLDKEEPPLRTGNPPGELVDD